MKRTRSTALFEQRSAMNNPFGGNLPTAGRFYREICKRLGVTEAGLKVLFRIKRGDDISGGNAGERLERDGLVTGYTFAKDSQRRRLTDAGLVICEKARSLGYLD